MRLKLQKSFVSIWGVSLFSSWKRPIPPLLFLQIELGRWALVCRLGRGHRCAWREGRVTFWNHCAFHTAQKCNFLGQVFLCFEFILNQYWCRIKSCLICPKIILLRQLEEEKRGFSLFLALKTTASHIYLLSKLSSGFWNLTCAFQLHCTPLLPPSTENVVFWQILFIFRICYPSHIFHLNWPKGLKFGMYM